MPKKKIDVKNVVKHFAEVVAQSLWGGVFTIANNKKGDLYHEEKGAFAEVKGCGDAQGIIIRRRHLASHMKGLAHHDRVYIFLYYKNKGNHNGTWCSLTSRIGTTEPLLQNFLAERTREVYVVDVRVVNAVYRLWKKKDERKWNMKEGPRQGLKLRACRFSPYVDDIQCLKKLRLDPTEYVVSREHSIAHFDGREIPVTVSRILRNDSNT